MFSKNATFECSLNNDTIVYVACSQLNDLIQSEPNDLMFYTDSDNCQGQCRKSELTFLSVDNSVW